MYREIQTVKSAKESVSRRKGTISTHNGSWRGNKSIRIENGDWTEKLKLGGKVRRERIANGRRGYRLHPHK